jgi:hypothetical protein
MKDIPILVVDVGYKSMQILVRAQYIGVKTTSALHFSSKSYTEPRRPYSMCHTSDFVLMLEAGGCMYGDKAYWPCQKPAKVPGLNLRDNCLRAMSYQAAANFVPKSLINEPDQPDT